MLRPAVLPILYLGLSLVGAQSPNDAAFQVASIHVHPHDKSGKIGFYSMPGGGVEFGMCKLSALVSYALDVDTHLIEGTPEWSTEIYYDIKALPPDDSPSTKSHLAGYVATPTPEQREMLLHLLGDRFGLKYHIADKEMPVYLLERGTGPLRLDPPKYPERAADPRGGLTVNGDLVTGQAFGQSATMDFLARQLEWPLERPVLNRTGIAGFYDFHVEPIEPDNHDKVRGSLLMVQALGLKLRTGRAPVRTVHIDAATQPTEN